MQVIKLNQNNLQLQNPSLVIVLEPYHRNIKKILNFALLFKCTFVQSFVNYFYISGSAPNPIKKFPISRGKKRKEKKEL